VGFLQSGAQALLHKKLKIMHVQHDLKQRGLVSLMTGLAFPVSFLAHLRVNQNFKSSWLIQTLMRGSAQSISIRGALEPLQIQYVGIIPTR